MSEVVRQRLELLLDEVQPRHAWQAEAFGPDSGPSPDAAQSDGRAGVVAAVDGRPRPWSQASALSQEDRAAAAPAEVCGEGRPRRMVQVSGAVSRAKEQVVGFTREHLAAVIVLLVVGCGWSAYSLLQARSVPVAMAAAPSFAEAPAVVASPTPTASSAATVVVHVLGAVGAPGVVELPQGARVQDAIEAAGGLRSNADPGELNLAAVVSDGSQIVVGTRAKPGGQVRGAASAGGGTGASSTGGAASGGMTVSLNSATIDELDSLPGIGPVTAQKILDWRAAHGPFTAVSQLQEVDGIGPKTYADLAPRVRV